MIESLTRSESIEFTRPQTLMGACYQEILIAGLGTRPRLKKPGRFGTFLSSIFAFSSLDEVPYHSTVDFLRGKFRRTLSSGIEVEVHSRAVSMSYQLQTGTHIKPYVIRQLLNRSFHHEDGQWLFTNETEPGDSPQDQEWVFRKGRVDTPVMGYYDLATRVLTVWNSIEVTAYLEGDHLESTRSPEEAQDNIELDPEFLEVHKVGT